MKPIERSEILGLGAYEEVRDRFRARVLAEKKSRYVTLGPNMTALFESRDSALLQIQEMLRTERITSEHGILHELETYNELVPGDHELSVTIFIEYPEREERDRMLVALAGVETCFYVEAGGERLAVVPDPRGTDQTRTMAVQYVKFPLTPAAEDALRAKAGPFVLGVEHAHYRARAELSPETVAALSRDLAG
jgi:hypothetical protein